MKRERKTIRIDALQSMIDAAMYSAAEQARDGADDLSRQRGVGRWEALCNLATRVDGCFVAVPLHIPEEVVA